MPLVGTLGEFGGAGAIVVVGGVVGVGVGVGWITVTMLAEGHLKKSAQGPVLQGVRERVSPTHQGPSRELFAAPQCQMLVQPSGFTVFFPEEGGGQFFVFSGC